MDLFLKILNRFFVFLGVIFFIIILLGLYLWITDPYEIKPVLRGDLSEIEDSIERNESLENNNSDINNATTTDPNPLLDEGQEAMLRSFGIDPANLPSEITPQMEACFVEKLGRERVDEIVNGGSPSAAELMTARSCL